MKIWRLDYSCFDGHGVIWGSSKKDVEDKFNAFLETDEENWDEHDMTPSVSLISEVDIPVDRKGLIDWLNTNLSMDNG